MTDKKGPDQGNIPLDFEEDDDIIELTHEVVVKPKKEEDDTDLQNTGTDIPDTPIIKSIATENPEGDSGDDDDIFSLDRAPDDASEAEGRVLDLDHAFAGDGPPPGEDEIIASAIAESLGPDDEEPTDDRINLSEAADSGFEKDDDDIILLNQEDDEPAGISESTAGADEQDGRVFDTEEEIELEYESTEDEYDFFAMEDRETIEDLETITMADEEPDGTAEKEMPFDPLADLNLDSADEDENIAMTSDSHAEPDLMALDDDDETLEFEGTENLPEMTDEIELEEADDLPDVTDELEFEDDDNLPDLKDEIEFEDDDDLPDLMGEVEFEEPDDLPGLMDEVEFEGAGNLSDLTAEMDLEFDEDEEGEPTASDDQTAENGDDMTTRSIETSLGADEAASRIDLATGPEFEIARDSGMANEEAESGTDFTAKTKEELRALAEAEDLTDFDDDGDLEFENEYDGSDIEDNGGLEFEDETEVTDIEDSGDPESEIEILAIEDLEDNSTEEEDDIIEITEFDEHFPEEDEKELERAGVLDASKSDEDDFLELIEVEEEGLAADEEVIQFDRTEDKIDSFFSYSLEDEPVLENEEANAVEGTPPLNTDMAMATASTADEDDEFDFSFDSSDISQQVDRLDTFLSDDSTPEPAVASLPGEDEQSAAEEDMLDDDQPAEQEADEPLPVSSAQINAILERAIKEKFGGKIENVIYEVIEKAVSKEIDRLKDTMLDTGEPGGGSGENT